MHISFCFLLIKTSVMTDTISRAAALCLAMGLACFQARGLGAGEYQDTSLRPSHTHCRGERKRSGWLFDPPVSTPVHILTWSQKPSTKEVFELREKRADLGLLQCHRMGDIPGREELYRQDDGKVSSLPRDD